MAKAKARWALLGGYIGLALTAATWLGLGRGVPWWVMPGMTGMMMLFALLHAAQRYSWRKALVFWGLSFVLSLALETLGVWTGRIYGPYHYTDRLGARFLDTVPYIIPMAWFMMMYPAMVVAERVTPASLRRMASVVAALAGLAMTAWDLVMDPLMVAGGHWVWEVKGPYFGVPLRNFFGWWLTTFLVVWLFQRWGGAGVGDPRWDREAVVAYGAVALGNALHAAVLGGRGMAELLGPAMVGAFAVTPWVWCAWWGAAAE